MLVTLWRALGPGLSHPSLHPRLSTRTSTALPSPYKRWAMGTARRITWLKCALCGTVSTSPRLLTAGLVRAQGQETKVVEVGGQAQPSFQVRYFHTPLSSLYPASSVTSYQLSQTKSASNARFSWPLPQAACFSTRLPNFNTCALVYTGSAALIQ